MIDIKNIIVYCIAFFIIGYMIYDAIKVSAVNKKDEKNGK